MSEEKSLVFPCGAFQQHEKVLGSEDSALKETVLEFCDGHALFSACFSSLRRMSSFSRAVRIWERLPFKMSWIPLQDSWMRWSVMRSWGKLYVRIFSLRSPVPIWLRRASPNSLACRSSSSWRRRERKTFMARSRFLIWDFSSWQLTTNPEGRWVMRTAL